MLSILQAIQSLSIYRPLLSQPPICCMLRAVRAQALQQEEEIACALGELGCYLSQNGCCDSLPTAVLRAVQVQQNAFTVSLARGETVKGYLLDNALRDLSALYRIATLPPSFFGEQFPPYGTDLPDAPFDTPWGESIQPWADFYKANGCGPFALHKACLWQNGELHPIRNPDPIRLGSLKGYQAQRQILLDNTLAFLQGKSANHILLYGDRGTGKSSTVKAILNEYADMGLRMIQVPKEELLSLPLLTERLAQLPTRCILFVDDLSFRTDDDRISSLKAVLEGGLAYHPENVLIYATSNRLHLIRESDRNQAERRAADTVQEEISLSDRFGITLTFLLPDRAKFFEIVQAIASEQGLQVEENKLLMAAEHWATEHGGRSPRYARQFVMDLCAKGGVL